jgi:O-antigen/teichoic acid export membrane protein
VTDNLLVALGLQKLRMYIGLLALAGNITGNLILVPMFGFMAAAWMTLATEAFVLGVSIRPILTKLDQPFPRPERVGRALLAAALITLGLLLVSQVNDSLVVLVVTFCVCYPALLFGLHAVSRDDLRILLRREAPA